MDAIVLSKEVANRRKEALHVGEGTRLAAPPPWLWPPLQPLKVLGLFCTASLSCPSVGLALARGLGGGGGLTDQKGLGKPQAGAWRRSGRSVPGFGAAAGGLRGGRHRRKTREVLELAAEWENTIAPSAIASLGSGMRCAT